MIPWLVIDANILLDAIRYAVAPDGAWQRRPAYRIVEEYLAGGFEWIFSEPIIEEYVRQFHHMRRNAVQRRETLRFDTKTFNAVLDAVRQGLGRVAPTEAEDAAAYDAIMDPAREEHLRDEDDFIYLAAAAHAWAAGVAAVIVIGSDDSDLYRLGEYKGIPIRRAPELGTYIRPSGPA